MKKEKILNKIKEIEEKIKEREEESLQLQQEYRESSVLSGNNVRDAIMDRISFIQIQVFFLKKKLNKLVKKLEVLNQKEEGKEI